MALLSIITGTKEPVLRQQTTHVPRVTKSVLALLRNMEETMRHAEGLGIAAPQVGYSLRMCIAKIDGKTVYLINPHIAWKSHETDTLEEGCLSLPGIFMLVPRALCITLTYMDRKGKKQERKLCHMDARIVQHEVDHLDGVLIVDYESTPQLKTSSS